MDHPIYTEMLGRGVRLTTSSGSTAEPIAQTAITGLLMLARNFPRWLDALFSAVLAIERAAVLAGVSLPFGGSLMIVARRDG